MASQLSDYKRNLGRMGKPLRNRYGGQAETLIMLLE
jgi:hypothetical protein